MRSNKLKQLANGRCALFIKQTVLRSGIQIPRCLATLHKHRYNYINHDIKGFFPSERALFKKQDRASSVIALNRSFVPKARFSTGNAETSGYTKGDKPLKTTSIFKVDTQNGCVHIRDGGQLLEIPFIWLRDHCRSERYYNCATNQKRVDADLLDMDMMPVRVAVTDNFLNIEWKDEHMSKFSLDWLFKNFYPGSVSRVVQRRLWDRDSIQSKLPCVQYDDHMGSEEGLRKTLTNLVRYGFCLVNEAPASLEGTKSVVEKVTFILETLFGGMWSFTSDASRSDTAYCTDSLGAHTDGTYMDLPAGIQVFQCLKHTGKGGETLLVDGFRAIEDLRKENPGSFDLLSQLEIPHEYLEPASEHSPGYHLYSLGKVIRLHPASKETIQLRFNPYDRAALNTVAPMILGQYYKAYDQLSRTIAKKEGELWIKLQPGTVLLIDNWRVMHGRSGYDGERVMCGCYLPRDEWISKARVLGLL